MQCNYCSCINSHFPKLIPKCCVFNFILSFFTSSQSLATGHNKLTRINLTVSPKGIELVDRVSGETLQQISIYRISYCSADATHNNVFAFISSAPTPTLAKEATESDSEPVSLEEFPSPSTDGPLTCHVFLCPKRKMAQNISLTVAKSFERAFEIWKTISHHRLINATRQKPRFDSSPSPRPDVIEGEEDERDQRQDEEQVMNLLIDLNADLTDIRKSYLQNTWVSFEETEMLMNLHKNAICS